MSAKTEYLFFDTETTGLVRNWKAPLSDLSNWPRLVQIAWAFYDIQGKPFVRRSYLIKPSGFNIPSDAVRIHGITTERANAEGVDLRDVLMEFAKAVADAKTVVAHNINYDEKVVGAEFMRKRLSHQLFDKKRLCTMRLATDFCQIPGPYGFKWPNLSELHTALFRGHYREAHEALADATDCAKCYFELKRRGVIG